jgi:tRNA(Met) cytidine acetyltransferase
MLPSLLEANARARRRQLVWLQGDADWARQQAAALLAATGWQQWLWVGAEAPSPFEAVKAAEVQRRLGSETDAVVFDAFAGFNPNAFGQSVGTIRGGGLMFLLTPAAANWCRFADPEHHRLAVLPYEPADVGQRFVRHLVRTLSADADVIQVLQSGSASGFDGHIEAHFRPPRSGSPLPAEPDDAAWVAPFRSLDQQRAVAAIVQALEDATPLVLTADRGRGKSAALGLAAARWLERHGGQVLVTAPGLGALDALFERLQASLPDGQLSAGVFTHPLGSVRYLTPDRLLHGDGDGELLLVDEAATIPAPVLSRLLTRFPRILFASTLHGYEGTGRGFAVRFRRELQRRAPAWRAFEMSQPVRWCVNDPLEQLSFRLLLLDAEPAPAAVVRSIPVSQLSYRRLDRDLLLQQPQLLEQLFGLLVLAHYRTTPGDLRILLDSPNLSVWVACGQQQLVGALLVVEEGGLPADLTQAIHEGRRRPPGHLIPQALIGQDGLLEAAGLRCLRVMRIATHPALERHGIASRLLAELADGARQQGADYLGTCFGMTPDLLAFWRRNGYVPMRLGTVRDPVGGTFAGILACALSPAGTGLVAAARQRLRTAMLHQLPAQLAELEADLVLGLLPGAPVELQHHERLELDMFARHNRAFESCEAALWKLCSAGPEFWQQAGLAPAAQRLLVWKLLQRRHWEDIARHSGGGRRALVRSLRLSAGRLLRAPAMGIMDRPCQDEAKP